MLSIRQDTWKNVERDIVVGVQNISGLNFYQNLIDVYFVSGFNGALSDPMVISLKFEGDRLVDVLTEEIIHRLLTDNVQKKNGSIWARNNYPDQTDKMVTNHILVNAIHKEIYLNVLESPDRLKRHIDSLNSPSYKTAWDIVEKEGHLNIIRKFRDS